ncbi:hypothetical protein DPEC_G00206160 [Dallia pectoralis]|uniref:Uncharacterized protein n=1 Tax=Dallia pectoralis TaxID=75939 RepID=A0ACC2G486_DALPE|nr:hypothetical protein DPEC_G00206160 [Dallia pectoralis]
MDPVLKAVQRIEKRDTEPVDHVAIPWPVTPPSPTQAIWLTLPRDYNRESLQNQGFLLQLGLHFITLSPAPSDREKVSALITCLCGNQEDMIWRGETTCWITTRSSSVSSRRSNAFLSVAMDEECPEEFALKFR